jgi:LysM repeat protein
LTRIAKSHGTTAKAIKSANNLKNDRINVGQKLKIPTRGMDSASASNAAIPGSGLGENSSQF